MNGRSLGKNFSLTEKNSESSNYHAGLRLLVTKLSSRSVPIFPGNWHPLVTTLYMLISRSGGLERPRRARCSSSLRLDCRTLSDRTHSIFRVYRAGAAAARCTGVATSTPCPASERRGGRRMTRVMTRSQRWEEGKDNFPESKVVSSPRILCMSV